MVSAVDYAADFHVEELIYGIRTKKQCKTCTGISYKKIWAAAGTPFAVFQLKPADLKSLTRGRWIDLSE
jgi:hypothetical protein